MSIFTTKRIKGDSHYTTFYKTTMGKNRFFD